MDVGSVFHFTFLNTGRYEFVYDILLLTRGRRCSGLTRYGILYDITFSHHRTTMQRPWRSLRSLSALVTRHSLVRAKGEVFVLLYVCFFLFVFCQRFLDNPRADSRQIFHAGVLWFRMCLLPLWWLAAPVRKKGKMKFSLLWESMGNF